jgi:hypothetical protein
VLVAVQGKRDERRRAAPLAGRLAGEGRFSVARARGHVVIPEERSEQEARRRLDRDASLSRQPPAGTVGPRTVRLGRDPV